jgi:hypothetical protein
MTDATNLFNERVQLYKDAARHKKTSRVLNLANIWTWKICDSGYKLSEALFDYNKMEDIVCNYTRSGSVRNHRSSCLAKKKRR